MGIAKMLPYGEVIQKNCIEDTQFPNNSNKGVLKVLCSRADTLKSS